MHSNIFYFYIIVKNKKMTCQNAWYTITKITNTLFLQPIKKVFFSIPYFYCYFSKIKITRKDIEKQSNTLFLLLFFFLKKEKKNRSHPGITTNW